MGLIGSFQARSAGEAATAVILVSGPRVDAISLVQQQRARGRSVIRREAPGSLALSIDDRPVIIKTLAEPYPEGELAKFLSGTWWWPDVIEETRGHTARILVHVPIAPGPPELETRDRHLLATALVEDLLAPDAFAVLWGGTGAVVPPDRFVALARGASRTELPITLWISVRFATVAGQRLAFTTGMRAFGIPEIESEAGDGDPAPLATAIFEAAHELLVSGAHPELTQEISLVHPRTPCFRL